MSLQIPNELVARVAMMVALVQLERQRRLGTTAVVLVAAGVGTLQVVRGMQYLESRPPDTVAGQVTQVLQSILHSPSGVVRAAVGVVP